MDWSWPGWTAISALAESVAALGGIATAAIALFLLAQGQGDRRRLAYERFAADAREVRVEYRQRQTGRGLVNEIKVTNDGERAIRIINFRLVEVEFDGLPLDHYVVRVGVDRTLAARSEVVLTKESWWYYRAVVAFRDRSGVEWERRSDDGEFRPVDRQSRLPQRAVARLCRAPLMRGLILGPWIALAYRAARKRPGSMPISVRVVRLLHGSWPEGEWDTYDEPPDIEERAIPPLWRFEGLSRVAHRSAYGIDPEEVERVEQ